jgi:hypothetical protein
MNRRVRNRTHGGVGGRRGDPASYPIIQLNKKDQKGQSMKSKKTVAVVLTEDGYRFLAPYIDPYTKDERSGKHIYGESFEQVGAFFVIKATPEITGDKIKDPMRIFIPLQCVKFAVEGVGASSMGFGAIDAPH